MTQVMTSSGPMTIGRGTRRVAGGGGLAQQFPAFQLASPDVQLSSLKVLAQSPSGRTKQLGVSTDPAGQFTTDFVPDEIGDWLVSILSDGVNISGSPFHVRVYDPGQVRVHGLEGGAMGRPCNFGVDTSCAGEGSLTVEVSYNGVTVPSTITQTDGATGRDYAVHFNPVGAGFYTVRICYANQEIAGSPYTVEIVDSGSVSLYGEGLATARINTTTFFCVNMGQNGGLPADIAVKITAPSGHQPPTQIVPMGDGSPDYRVEFTPLETGDHRIEVCYYGQPVAGCPYICSVVGNRIIVTNIPTTAILGRVVCFDIDAEDSGTGKLEILINNGLIPCTVENGDSGRRYRASFSPTECGTYLIAMKFNTQIVYGSPWKVQVVNADHVRLESSEYSCVHVNTSTGFKVLTSPYDGQISILVTSPSGRALPAKIAKSANCEYAVDFTPTETGTHTVLVTYEGLPVMGSPFLVNVCDSDAVLITPVACAMLGNTVEFTVDASKAGPGDLDITVNRGSIPSQASLLRPAVYSVSFVPPSAGKYITDIKFNGQTIPESPMVTQVIDVTAVQIHGGASPYTRVGKSALIRVDTQLAGEGQITASVMSPSCQSVPVRITPSAGGCFQIEFTPVEPGPHRVDVDFAGVHVPSSPVVVLAYDVNRIRVLGVVDGLVGQKSAFSIALQDCGEGELEVVIMSSHGRPILNQVTALEPGRLEATYTPMEGGIHYAEITFNKEHVPGSPFKFNVFDASKVSARGDGLCLVPCNQRATFNILAPDAKLSNIDVKITSPTGRDILPNITELSNNSGNFRVDYTPTQTGIYEVAVTYFCQPITGSPFQVKVWDAAKVLVANIRRGHVGIESCFDIELGDAGDGTVEISIMDPCGQLIPNHVTTKGPGLLQVNYVPNIMGDHRINIVFNGTKIPGCPMVFNVLDASTVTARGEGLDLVQVNSPTAFIVRAPEAKQRDLDIKVIGPNGTELITNISETSSGSFKVVYTPNVVGTFQIPITYCGTMIAGSPFTARAWDASRVLLADIGMGQVGCNSSFKVIVADAGEGVCEISITDPTGQLLANQASPIEPGVVLVSYIPSMIGHHKGNILFNKQKVPASPFSFIVIDPTKVTVQGQGLGLVPVKRLTSFTVNAPVAQRKDIDVRVTGPTGLELVTNITEVKESCFKVDYTPLISGDHMIDVCYFGRPLPGGVWKTKAWDLSKVVVGNMLCGRVGREAAFTVDVREAGEGKLEISVIGPNRQNIENVVSAVSRAPGVFQVSCVPGVAGPHQACVTFNDQDVLGSPFTFLVTDPSSASASGEGLQSVRCGKQTSFTVRAPAAQTNDVTVKIKGPRLKDIPCRLHETAPGFFHVDYTPTTPGEYLIEIRYFDCPINDSPFTAIAWDASLVQVTNIRPGIVCKPTAFNINASDAGPGSLEVAITSRGESVRNVARKVDTTGLIEVSYTPIYLDPHIINVRFNGEQVNGSPFVASMLDGSLATAQGVGLGRVRANEIAQFEVMTRPVGGEADLLIYIASPTGQHVPAYITGSPFNNFHVEYKPIEAGRHTVNICCAGMDIKGSPFYPEVFDPSQVLVTRAHCGTMGKPVTFKVDTTMAGQGRIMVDVRGERTHPSVDIAPSVNNVSVVSFVPQEGSIHNIIVKFNDCDVPGCPFHVNVIDQKSLEVRWEAVRLTPVGRPAIIELDVTSSPEASVTCTVTDTYGKLVATKQRRTGSVYGYLFIPVDVGPHIIDMKYGCDAVPGSPFTCNVYDISRVRIIDATACGNIGQEVGITVDTSEAGMGVLDGNVMCGSASVPVRRQQLAPDKSRFNFVAKSPVDYIIELTFNGEPVPNSPLVWRIVNPASKMCLTNGTAAKSVAIGQVVWGLIQNPGYPISTSDLTATVAGPTGDLIPVRINQQSDGSVRVEYTSMYVGTHLLAVDYAGQLIPGSPLQTEVFDPNKVLIEGSRLGEVGHLMTLDINYSNAGCADLTLSVTDPHGQSVPYEVELTPLGQRIAYVPQEPGTHKIHVTFGGMDVTGCPVRQEIRANIPVTAAGDGLVKGLVGMVATFFIDSRGQKGELLAQIQGPTSVARIQIEPEQGGRMRINYMPAEVGIFTINLQFNGHEVDGCPFHPRIIDPSKVEVVDDWSCWTAPDRLKVPLNELKTILFDTSCAGPGQLTATIDGPDGLLCPDVLQTGMDGYAVKFVPRKQGDYYIRVHWNSLPICRFPIIATVDAPPSPPPPPPQLLVVDCELPPPPPPPCPIDASRLCISGPGLMAARVLEPAQFVIDGQLAGPGIPCVKIVGVQSDIDCCIEQIGDNIYGCTYVPTKPGAYLLSIMWSDQFSPRSPYKVTVYSSSDASKVMCTGDGLRCGVLGQTINALIDARRAGLGEVVARCDGPTRPAFCDIEDRHDGTFELNIRAQEVGKHHLHVTFGGEHVVGSPFILMVMCGPDASKVMVDGEGINHGILATFNSDFSVDTRGAGPGKLTVKVRAKRGAFRVEMRRNKDNDRLINCRYHPTEIGEYYINVQWAGQHVPGSPFRVIIVDTNEELRRLTTDPTLPVNGVIYMGAGGSQFGTISNLGGTGAIDFADDR